ncbi:MAG: glycosyltransferase family 4 protein, partial [Verrucomicrobia bacterium]|nr:glycosyltransferase family 4 protein [Verrucomicrobiota bacterium]
MENSVHRVAFLGNYLPRRCGIATFTTDLCESVAAAFPDIQCFALPMNDRPQGYDYPPTVRFEINDWEQDAYRRAAEFLNLNHADVLCVQHEFGIFGGEAGGYLLNLLRGVSMPVVTTLHTVLEKPNDAQRRVMTRLGQFTDRFVVMTQKAEAMLQSIHAVPKEKIDLIPHGIPDMPFVDPNFYKDQFEVEGKFVLLTFGLLSPGKGIENVIEALPAILKRHPNVVYMVLGATHPNIVASEGEAYRSRLEQLAQERGVGRQVRFHNRFVSLEELKEYIDAADIYITPYLNPAQITSGTLAYTFGAGKAVVSTPYWHAEELLADGRGVLVPFQDPPAIARAINDLIEHEAERHAMRKAAYLLGREMIWPAVARRYVESFERARSEHASRARQPVALRTFDSKEYQLPALKLDHLLALTD